MLFDTLLNTLSLMYCEFSLQPQFSMCTVAVPDTLRYKPKLNGFQCRICTEQKEDSCTASICTYISIVYLYTYTNAYSYIHKWQLSASWSKEYVQTSCCLLERHMCQHMDKTSTARIFACIKLKDTFKQISTGDLLSYSLIENDGGISACSKLKEKIYLWSQMF